MINYFKLTPYESMESCKLLLEVFKEDPWFTGKSKDELFDCFRDAFHYCVREGEIWGAFEDTEQSKELIGVSMWFKYIKGQEISHVLCKELREIIDPFLPESTPVIYRLYTGILPKYRGEGIGKALLRKMLLTYPGTHFITSVPNSRWAVCLEGKGWSEISGWENCKILMR